jgi:hypothetical protein
MCIDQGNISAHLTSIPTVAWVIDRMGPSFHKEILKEILELEYGVIGTGLAGHYIGVVAGGPQASNATPPAGFAKRLHPDPGDDEDNPSEKNGQISHATKRAKGDPPGVKAESTGQASSNPDKPPNIAYIDLTDE